MDNTKRIKADQNKMSRENFLSLCKFAQNLRESFLL